MILVLSTPGDEHALTVVAELAKLGSRAQILDLGDFPERLALKMKYNGGRRLFAFGCEDGGLDLDDCGAVWWRRPQPPRVSPCITRDSHRLFALSECQDALAGLWQALDVFWVNEPMHDQAAHRKAYQLRVAQDVGLEIPSTLVTNCPLEAREFIEVQGAERVIYKAFSATEEEWRETRLLRPGEIDLLDDVRFAPVIFQQYIEAEYDLRVTVVGDEIYAAAIHSQDTSYKEDFRIDIANARIEPTQVPHEVEDLLRSLMHRLGLVYGAIDMRLGRDGRYVFLEINPAGQWLFVERVSGQAIAQALARTLHAHDI